MGRRVTWRWAVVVTGLAAALALPGAVALLPVQAAPVSPAALLAKVRASAGVAWSGYGESRGALDLPDVKQLGDLASLVGGTTRARAWWRGAHSYRIDALSLVGETDVAQDPTGSWTWSSADRRALRIEGALAVRLPRAGDLLAPVVGARLSRSRDVRAGLLPVRRVAGRAAAGLRLVPRHPGSTTVDEVDLWADPATGLPLRVEVRAGGRLALTSVLLDVDLARPAAARTRFAPPRGVAAVTQEAPDLAALVDRFSPYQLPSSLAGLPRTDAVRGLRGGVATYGEGLGAFALVPLPRNVARDVSKALATSAGVVSTPLVNALVIRDGRRSYLLAGTVPGGVLDRAALQLRRQPPPRREGA